MLATLWRRARTTGCFSRFRSEGGTTWALDGRLELSDVRVWRPPAVLELRRCSRISRKKS